MQPTTTAQSVQETSDLPASSSHIENRSFLAHSMAASSWISIFLGIIMVLIIVAVATFVYLKRRLLFKKFNENPLTNKSTESKIYSSVDETSKSKAKDEKFFSGDRRAKISPRTGPEMTVNVLYSSFDPVADENDPQKCVELDDSVENKSSEMKENILYDGY